MSPKYLALRAVVMYHVRFRTVTPRFLSAGLIMISLRLYNVLAISWNIVRYLCSVYGTRESRVLMTASLLEMSFR